MPVKKKMGLMYSTVTVTTRAIADSGPGRNGLSMAPGPLGRNNHYAGPGIGIPAPRGRHRKGPPAARGAPGRARTDDQTIVVVSPLTAIFNSTYY
jgi:hypothetical protein